ncbi:MAG: 3'-5' exonuclease [bacterium]|nr:3'-5' exonuclease [bacterium]
MFKKVHSGVWVFDAEWVPDADTGRRVYGLDAAMADVEVVDEMFRRGGATEDDPRPYLKTVLCRLVSISAVARTDEEGVVRLQLHSLPRIAERDAPEAAESVILRRFLDGIGRAKPQMVGYNSWSADFRILMQRAVALGVQAADFAKRPDKPWEGVDYFGGGDWHIDLIEVLAGRGRDRPSLHEMAAACGIPGKFSGAGDSVVDAWQQGKLAEIIAYNEFDALTTYLLWLRVAYFGGFFDAKGYELEQSRVRELLQREGARPERVHLLQYLRQWDSVRRADPTGSAQLQFGLA